MNGRFVRIRVVSLEGVGVCGDCVMMWVCTYEGVSDGFVRCEWWVWRV